MSNGINAKTTVAGLDTRVGKLEGVVESLSHTVQSIDEKFNAFLSTMGAFKEDVMAQIGRATAPKWPLIVGFATVIVMLLGMGGTLVGFMFSGQGAQIEVLTNAMNSTLEQRIDEAYKHGYNNAHTGMIDKKIDNLDLVLQREMKDRDEIISTEISSLDARLQREMTLLNDTQNAKLDALTKEIGIFREDTIRHIAEGNHPYGVLLEFHETISREVDSLREEISARSASRFTKEDYQDYDSKLQVKLSEIDKTLRELAFLVGRVEALEKQVDRVAAEQIHRTTKVYKE